jgi:hypothetical protein
VTKFTPGGKIQPWGQTQVVKNWPQCQPMEIYLKMGLKKDFTKTKRQKNPRFCFGAKYFYFFKFPNFDASQFRQTDFARQCDQRNFRPTAFFCQN